MAKQLKNAPRKKFDFASVMHTGTVREMEDHKVLMPIGACMDIPTGIYVKTIHGRWRLNGGVSTTNSIAGKGNSFKSYMVMYQALSAAIRVYLNTGYVRVVIYDTEATSHRSTIMNTIKEICGLYDVDPNIFTEKMDDSENSMFIITDATQYSLNAFMTEHREYWATTKLPNKKKLSVGTSLPKADGTGEFEMMIPDIVVMDSLSDARTDGEIKMDQETELGDSKANMMGMNGARAKSRLLGTINRDCLTNNSYWFFTGQLGKHVPIATGGREVMPEKDIPTSKYGEKITGVSVKFFYSMSNAWKGHNAAPLQNVTGSGAKKSIVPKYPRDSSQTSEKSHDLNMVPLQVSRSKSGQSWSEESIIVTQTQGVRPALTEFYRCHQVKKMYGMVGNLQTYAMTLLPDITLSRTTIRRKLKAHPELARAINITSELSQIYDYHRNLYKDVYLSPQELYDKLIERGYSWDKILKTRGWYSVNDDPTNLPVSTMDLLQTAAGNMDLPECMDDKDVAVEKGLSATRGNKNAKKEKA